MYAFRDPCSRGRRRMSRHLMQAAQIASRERNILFVGPEDHVLASEKPTDLFFGRLGDLPECERIVDWRKRSVHLVLSDPLLQRRAADLPGKLRPVQEIPGVDLAKETLPVDLVGPARSRGL